jgi:hypothetical protein
MKLYEQFCVLIYSLKISFLLLSGQNVGKHLPDYLKVIALWMQYQHSFQELRKKFCVCVIEHSVLVVCQYNVMLVDKCATTNTFFSLLDYIVLDITKVSKQLMFVDPCIIVHFIKKNPTRCNNVSEFYYSTVHWRLNMFLAAYRSLSGALNSIWSLWFTYACGDRP